VLRHGDNLGSFGAPGGPTTIVHSEVALVDATNGTTGIGGGGSSGADKPEWWDTITDYSL
jgi:hypothetical protein